MEANNMMGEPNQLNPSSIFGFDPYPPPYMVNWNNSNPFDNTESRVLDECGSRPLMHPIIPPAAVVPNVPTQGPQMSYVMIQEQPPPGAPYTNFPFGRPDVPRPVKDVVHFPFNITNTGSGQREFRCKRKTDSPPLQPRKQHITEEIMAEHMSNLHISSESSSSKESESTRMQRLYMCEEMRKFHSESILPQCLLNRIQQPCTALVLWKPPTKLIPADNENDNESANCDAESSNVMADEAVEIDIDNEIDNEIGSVNTMDLDNC